MLQPKRLKYRKPHRVKLKQKTVKGSTVSFGDYGLKAIQAGRITNRQIESARIAMTRHMKREGQVWIRIFPDRPITKKPLEVRMGKGKGALDHYVAMVQPGRIMFEITGVSQEVAFEALRLAAQKLPVLTKVSMRPEVVKF
ncbi:MAG: 50S ribosomal protein L16 [Saprospiraceae bacterium]|jgi:large subunit ribosomal protein L16